MTISALFKLGVCAFMLSIALPAAAQTPAAAKPVIVRLAYVTQPTHSFGIGAKAFKEELTKLTRGKYEVQEFPAGALGGERENMEQLQIGALEIAVITAGVMGNFVPETGILDIPFLFKNSQHAQAVMDGPVGEELLQKFSKHHMVGLAWGESGFRQLANSKRPVVTPEDLKGIKLRTMEVPVHIKGFKTLGAQPTPISFPEVYAALQQGTVDAVESPTQTMLTSKFFQVQKYLSMTNHIYAASAFLASKRFMDGLPESDKKAFYQAARVGAKVMRKAVVDNEAAQIEELKKLGMQVTTKVDTAKFQAVLAPAYADFAKQYGQASIDRIKNYPY
jgi:tripartite ATP-independent transporter DctP family solute receptor